MTEAGSTPDQRGVQWVFGSDTLPISETDYRELLAECEQVSRRLREEVLFEQLATNVVELHQAMVRFASRLSAASRFAFLDRATWARTETECSLMLRIANVLSASFSFTEAVEQDGRHQRHECGNPICTIARELRNQLQHDVLGSRHRYGSIPTSHDTPGVPIVVRLRVRWKDVRDSIKRSSRKKRRFEKACSSAFPKLEEIDVFTVVREHLRCISDVMTDVRRQAPADELVTIHKRLSRQGEPSQRSEPWNRCVVSPKGMTVHLQEAEDKVVLIRGMMSVADRLPDLDLVRFGEGRPAPGGGTADDFGAGTLQERAAVQSAGPRVRGSST